MKKLHDLDNGVENIKVDTLNAVSTFSNNVDAFEYQINGAPFVLLDANDQAILEFDENLAYFTLKIHEGYGIMCSDGGIILAAGSEHISITSPLVLPIFTTALRPTVDEGTIIYDSTLKKCILYNGTAWVNLDGTALS